MQTPRRTIRIPAEDEAAIRTYVKRTPGATVTSVLLAGARELINRELAPESLVVSWLNDYDTITIGTRHGDDTGDVVEIVGAKARLRKAAGRKLSGSPRPIEELVRVAARPVRGGRTVVELLAHDPNLAGAAVFVAALPAGAEVTLTVAVQDLDPGLRPAEVAE